MKTTCYSAFINTTAGCSGMIHAYHTIILAYQSFIRLLEVYDSA